jgi:hypothetical protein
MPSMLITVKISKGFETWSKMAKSLEKEAGADVSSTTIITPIGDYWLG